MTTNLMAVLLVQLEWSYSLVEKSQLTIHAIMWLLKRLQSMPTTAAMHAKTTH